MTLFSWVKYFRYRPHMLLVARREWQKRRSPGGRVRVAVIGCGGGGLMHISHYAWHPEAEIRVVADQDADRFRDLDTRMPFLSSVERMTDCLAACAHPDVDAVSVCTPDHTHADYAIAALRAGKHVLCEKPMATTIEDSRRIMQAVRESGKLLVVFQQMRFAPRNAAIKRLIDEDELGELFHLEAGYIHDMRDRATEFSLWRMDPALFQHPIFGGCHHVDMLRWFGADPVEAHTRGGHRALPGYPADDTYTTTFKLRNGGTAYVLTCFGPRVPREFHPLRLYGLRGSVHDTTVFLERPEGISERPLGARDYRGVPDFRSQISHFIDCVRGRSAPLVDAVDGARTVAACWAAVESWKTGQPVAVPQIEPA